MGLSFLEIMMLAGVVTVSILVVAMICGMWPDEEECGMCGGLGERFVESEFMVGRMMKCPMCSGTGHRSGK